MSSLALYLPMSIVPARQSSGPNQQAEKEAGMAGIKFGGSLTTRSSYCVRKKSNK